MQKKESSHEKINSIMHCLSCLPRKILGLHGRDNITEFVLHELSKKECFDLEKAAYIIDNPDFDCLRGVAGFCRSECYTDNKNIWDDPDSFSEHMKKASYNKKVRCFQRESCLKKGKKSEEIVKDISSDLGFSHPLFYAWNMKHDNQGILLYEKKDSSPCSCDYLLDGLCLIGFCPVF